MTQNEIEIDEAINLAHIVPPNRDISKMLYYKNKGSNPKRLVKDISGNLDKLVARYFISIAMPWDEFAEEVERAQHAGELTPAFTKEVMDSTLFQASKYVLPATEDDSFTDAIRDVRDGQDQVTTDSDQDLAALGVTKPDALDIKFTNVFYPNKV